MSNSTDLDVTLTAGPAGVERPGQNVTRPDDPALAATIFGCSMDCSTRPFCGWKARNRFGWSTKIRAATQQLRQNPRSRRPARLRDRLASLELSELRTLTRAFSLYFDLVNLAEQQARVRALRRRAEQAITGRCPKRPRWGFGNLQRARPDGRRGGRRAAPGSCPAGFTAHPSEARRRTILEKLEAIADAARPLE